MGSRHWKELVGIRVSIDPPIDSIRAISAQGLRGIVASACCGVLNATIARAIFKRLKFLSSLDERGKTAPPLPRASRRVASRSAKRDDDRARAYRSTLIARDAAS